jgi:hypothetical protein
MLMQPMQNALACFMQRIISEKNSFGQVWPCSHVSHRRNIIWWIDKGVRVTLCLCRKSPKTQSKAKQKLAYWLDGNGGRAALESRGRPGGASMSVSCENDRTRTLGGVSGRRGRVRVYIEGETLVRACAHQSPAVCVLTVYTHPFFERNCRSRRDCITYGLTPHVRFRRLCREFSSTDQLTSVEYLPVH